MDKIGNLLAAQAMVEAMPESAFSPSLAMWRNVIMRKEGPHACGAVGCFGGWIAQEPFFQGLGVRASKSDGMPMLPASGLYPSGTAFELFGNEDMFTRKHYTETGTEKSIILARIRAALERQIEGAE